MDLLRSGGADLFASNRAGLLFLNAKLSGYRILEERLFAVEHAMALPKGRGAGLGYAKAFIEEAKASGAIAQSITRHHIAGVEVAPPAGRR
jgi:polar amino acid transport system substrate-binding protein